MDERTKEQVKNMSLAGKLSHYWYYYKWYIIILGAFLLFFIICITQCASKVSPDASIMSVGHGSISSEYMGSVNGAISEIMLDDYNGDGKKHVDLLQINLILDTKDTVSDYIMQQKEQWERYDLELGMGASVIYLLDESLYLDLRENNDILVKLSDVCDAEILPDETYDEYGIRLSSLPSYYTTALRYFDGDRILCVRKRREANIAKDNDNVKQYESNINVFRDLMKYGKED